MSSIGGDEGIFESLMNTDRYGVSSALFQGDAEGKSLFNFLAANTAVEWSLVQFDHDSEYIATNHLDNLETGGATEAYDLARNKIEVREFDHSHPISPDALVGPSGCFPEDKNYGASSQLAGDIGLADKIMRANQKFFDNTIIFNIYDQNSSQIIRYDNQNILYQYNQPWDYTNF